MKRDTSYGERFFSGISIHSQIWAYSSEKSAWGSWFLSVWRGGKQSNSRAGGVGGIIAGQKSEMGLVSSSLARDCSSMVELLPGSKG